MYELMRNAHLLIILSTFVLFIISFVLTLKDSQKPQSKLLKIGPHILYTLFILTFIYLAGYKLMNDLPMSSTWLLSKLGGFVFYVLSIALALHWAKKKLWRFVGLISAIFWLVMSARLGFAKHLMVKGAGEDAQAYLQSAQSFVNSLV